MYVEGHVGDRGVFVELLVIMLLLTKMYQAYMVLNDIDAAVESFKKALTLEPNDG